MDGKGMVPQVNHWGEFSNPDLEREFAQQDMAIAKRYIRPVMLFLGILNTLFLIPDYLQIHNIESIRWILILRLSFLVFVVQLFLRFNRIKSYKTLNLLVTVYEIIGIVIFLFVFYQYESPDFLIQAYGVMVLLLVVFLVPNRWSYMNIVSLFVSLAFFGMSWCYLPHIQASEFSAGIVYTFIVIALCSIISYRNHYYKRVEFSSRKELIRLSTTDPLSGVYNRSKFDEELIRWVSYSLRHQTPLSLVLLDFDDFKNINDTYGHLVGDSVLVESAHLIQSQIRETDVFARWGGEEFVILLPHTEIGHAVDLSERLQKTLERYSHQVAGQVTCSFGVTQLAVGDGVEGLLHKADQMLYAAKRTGKNVVKSTNNALQFVRSPDN